LGHSEIVELLLDHRAELRQEGPAQTSVMSLSLAASNPGVTRALLRKGATLGDLAGQEVQKVRESLLMAAEEELLALQQRGPEAQAESIDLRLLELAHNFEMARARWLRLGAVRNLPVETLPQLASEDSKPFTMELTSKFEAATTQLRSFQEAEAAAKQELQSIQSEISRKSAASAAAWTDLQDHRAGFEALRCRRQEAAEESMKVGRQLGEARIAAMAASRAAAGEEQRLAQVIDLSQSALARQEEVKVEKVFRLQELARLREEIAHGKQAMDHISLLHAQVQALLTSRTAGGPVADPGVVSRTVAQ